MFYTGNMFAGYDERFFSDRAKYRRTTRRRLYYYYYCCCCYCFCVQHDVVAVRIRRRFFPRIFNMRIRITRGSTHTRVDRSPKWANRIRCLDVVQRITAYTVTILVCERTITMQYAKWMFPRLCIRSSRPSFKYVSERFPKQNAKRRNDRRY